MNNDISLTPFDINPDCPTEDKQIIHRIIQNIKINLFRNTKTVTQHTLYKHHLSHYIPAIFLTTDQLNKNYIFQLTDENGNTITQYNNHNDHSLEQLVRIFISGHEMKQDRNRLSAITQSS